MAQTVVGIRLEETTQARLKALGERRDRSPHYLMKEAIEAFLSREEEIEAEKARLKQRWERFELTGETLRQDEMTAWAASLPDSE